MQLGAAHPDNPYFGTAARLRYLAGDVGPRESTIDGFFTRLLAGAKGMHYATPDGRQILDATSGLWCVNAGHGREEIKAAIAAQLEEMDYAPSFQMGHPKSFELAARHAAMLPGDLNHAFYCNSGSEAVDSALKIALAYQRAETDTMADYRNANFALSVDFSGDVESADRARVAAAPVRSEYAGRRSGTRRAREGMHPMPQRLKAVLLGVAVALAAGACQALDLRSPATDQAVQIGGLYNAVFAIAAVVFFLVEGLIVWSVIRYRRKPTDRNLPTQTHGNLLLEIVWTVIPMATVIALFVASYNVLNAVDARDASAAQVKVEVVGYQWQWKFAYPDNGIEVFGTAAQEPQLVVPIGKTIQVSLVGQDVNHAFYVPEFLFQRDAVPGQVNVFQFTPNKLGTFHGQCSAFCGLLHHAMRFSVKVVSPEEYDAWLADNAPKPSSFVKLNAAI